MISSVGSKEPVFTLPACRHTIVGPESAGRAEGRILAGERRCRRGPSSCLSGNGAPGARSPVPARSATPDSRWGQASYSSNSTPGAILHVRTENRVSDSPSGSSIVATVTRRQSCPTRAQIARHRSEGRCLWMTRSAGTEIAGRDAVHRIFCSAPKSQFDSNDDRSLAEPRRARARSCSRSNCAECPANIPLSLAFSKTRFSVPFLLRPRYPLGGEFCTRCRGGGHCYVSI
jgi:hypothetical protein